MKKTLKLKFAIILISIVTHMTVAITPAYAASASGNEMLCQRDFLSFISSVISYDGFTESWKDILYRYNKNICYYMDINSVLKQLEKVREDIRKSFYTCDHGRAEALKKRYYELEAELFFLRNFVDISLSEIKKLPDNKIYEQLRSNFVIGKSYFDEDRAKELFDTFKKKYEQKVKSTYKNCADPGIDALTKKFKSLKNSFKNMGASSTSSSITETWNNSINAPVKRTGNFLSGFSDVRINGLSPKKAGDQILKDLQKSYETSAKQKNEELAATGGGTVNTGTSSSSSQPTLEQLQIALVQNEIVTTETAQSANLKAKYTVLYKEGTDTMIKSFKAKLKELDKLINDTLPHFVNLKECAKKSAEKQCKS